MTPLEFDGVNVIFAKNQDEYVPLPAHRNEDEYGQVTTCWGMSWRERWHVFLTGRVWVQQLTFHTPLQPQKVSAYPVIRVVYK